MHLTGWGRTGRASVLVCHPASQSRVRVSEFRVADLDEFLHRFGAIRSMAEFSVGWIDALARGGPLGRGIPEVGEFIDGGGYERAPILQVSVPFPVFQCVIPDEAAPRGIRRLLDEVMHPNGVCFLAVLETFGSEGLGYLSFPMRGFTLALDVPRQRASAALFSRLEAIALDHGGRVYLAKDAMLSAETFRRMYPRHGMFSDVLARVDPTARMPVVANLPTEDRELRIYRNTHAVSASGKDLKLDLPIINRSVEGNVGRSR